MNTNVQCNPQEDAAALRKAMKGLGTDEDKIIKICANRNYQQRKAIFDSYRSQFDRDLVKDIKDELRGKLEDTIVALFTEPAENDAINLKKAMKGAGTDEDTLMEILASRPTWYIKRIKEIYRIKYNKDLIDDIKSDLSGDLKQIMMSICNCEREDDPKVVDQNKCKRLSEELYNAGENKAGTNEDKFYDILTKTSGAEIYCINQFYTQSYGHDLVHAIDNEFSGKCKRLLTNIVYAIVNPPEFFAKRLKASMKGMGTKDQMLIRLLVSRMDIDLPQIKVAYKNLFKKELVDDIKSETSGDYKKMLVDMVS